MIKIRMVLHSAITGKASILAEIKIVNDGTGTPKRGNYAWWIWGKRERLIKHGYVKNWPRESYSSLALLQKVLDTAYPKK